MKNMLILLLVMITANSFAQITSIWKGNTPGHESQWECPSNWSNNRVPDEFTDVIIQVDISNDYHYPVFNMSETEINSLRIWPGAYLHLKSGNLFILDAASNYFNRSQIVGKGKPVLVDDPQLASNNKKGIN